MRRLLGTALVSLTLIALTLGVLVLVQGSRGTQEVTASGDVIGLSDDVHGLKSTLLLPSSEVQVRVGSPLPSIDHAEVDSSEHDDDEGDDGYQDPPDVLVAPEGGRLVPVTWRVRALGGFAREGDRVATSIRIVAGEQEVELWSARLADSSDTLDAYDLRSAVVAVADDVALEDLGVQVEFDGLVQTLDVATGEIDAGVAQALYEPRRFSTGCEAVSDDCDFVAASPTQRVRPAYHGFTASGVALYPYDGELGWADDGTLWAATRIQVFGGVAYDAAGATYSAPDGQPTAAELDGVESVLNGLQREQQTGRVVFSLPDTAVPGTLVLRQDARLSDSSLVMALRAEVPLT